MNEQHSINLNFIDLNNLDEKTKIYFNDFIPNDLFWGFGIENESYLEFINVANYKKYNDILQNTKRERYSVDYNTSYDLDIRKKEVFDNKINDSDDLIKLPLILNAYAMQTMDMNGQHRTTYEKVPKPNRKFGGKSIMDILKEENKFFIEEQGIGKVFAFDGDTIEFTTRYFYKTTLQKIIKEFTEKHEKFVMEFNNVMERLNYKFIIDICKFNYGFVNFYSNPNNTGLFNNGTYHFNLTLPTKLDNDTNPLHVEKFINIHKNVGKIIQWFSPFFVACYGSSDIYSLFSSKYAFGSQRVIASRYISIGTFDFDNPTFGKVLQVEKSELLPKLPEYFWLNRIEEKTGYKLTEKIGMDFNMLKHKNLGIEWRIMDMFPYEFMEDFILTLFLIIDYCSTLNIHNPIYDNLWNNLVYNCVSKGWSYVPNKNYIKKMDDLFNLSLYSEWKKLDNRCVYNYFNLLIDEIYMIMEKRGFGMLYNNMNESKRKPVIYNWNRMKWEKEIDYYYTNYTNEFIKSEENVYHTKDMLQIRTLFYLESKGKINIKKYKKKKIYLDQI
jgi:hypothetical protein